MARLSAKAPVWIGGFGLISLGPARPGPASARL